MERWAGASSLNPSFLNTLILFPNWEGVKMLQLRTQTPTFLKTDCSSHGNKVSVLAEGLLIPLSRVLVLESFLEHF